MTGDIVRVCGGMCVSERGEPCHAALRHFLDCIDSQPEASVDRVQTSHKTCPGDSCRHAGFKTLWHHLSTFTE